MNRIGKSLLFGNSPESALINAGLSVVGSLALSAIAVKMGL